jgi:hypothetical protein
MTKRRGCDVDDDDDHNDDDDDDDHIDDVDDDDDHTDGDDNADEHIDDDEDDEGEILCYATLMMMAKEPPCYTNDDGVLRDAYAMMETARGARCYAHAKPVMYMMARKRHYACEEDAI